MAKLLARHICTEHICEEELFGKKHSHPTQVLPSDGSGGISAYLRGEWHRECSGTVGNHKSPLQEQGSIQQARAIQMSKKVIWEGFNTGMPALLLHKTAKVSSALLACGHNIQ